MKRQTKTNANRLDSFSTGFNSLLAVAIIFSISTASDARQVLIDQGSGVGLTGKLVGGGGAGGSLDDPSSQPDDPFQAPRKPGQPYLKGRTSSSITMEWRDNSSYEDGFRLYRGTGFSGPWTQIGSWGAMPGNSDVMQFADDGLHRDNGYYYRVGAYNSHGESFSQPQHFATNDGRQFSRLQLRLRTSNIKNSDSDNDVNVSLSDYDNGGTWLDYGRDDFERGDDFTYELMTNGASDLSDINNIRLLKTGKDGWCVESVALLADGIEVFNRDFSNTPSGCHWLDDSRTPKNYLYIGRPELRAHSLWQAYQKPIPQPWLKKDDLASRIEGTVGHVIHAGVPVDMFPFYQGTLSVNWTGDALDRDRHIAITKQDDQAVHVHFELDINTPGPGGVTGGIDFDLRFKGICRTDTTPAIIEMKTENVSADADFDWTTEALSLWLVNFLEGNVADRIEASFPDLSQSITVDNAIVSCLKPVVDDDGSIDFDITLEQGADSGVGDGIRGRVLGGLTPVRLNP